MFSSTVSHGNDVYFWNTMPRSRPGPVTAAPLTRTSPVSGRSSPAMIRRMVDLPQPDGPSSTRNSPISRPSADQASSTSRLMLRNAWIVSPCGLRKLRLTLRRLILTLFSMRLGGNGISRSDCGCPRVRRPRRPAPREQAAFEECQQTAEQERRKTDRDNAGVDALEIQHLPRRFYHVADA